MNPEPHNNYFITSLAGPNIDLTIINIEEMTAYCKGRKRFANIITEKQTYNELEKLNYALIMNYKNPKPRVVNTKNKEYLDVINSLKERYKGGLLIIESDTISDPISETLCNGGWKQSDVDIMICRSFSTMTKEEMKRTDFLRISADPDFDPMLLQGAAEVLEEKTMTLMICQLFVNDNYESANRYIEKQNEHYPAQGISEYIDYYELNKQLAYFVYLDMKANKIIGIDKKTVITFINQLRSAGLPIVPEAETEIFAEMITIQETNEGTEL